MSCSRQQYGRYWLEALHYRADLERVQEGLTFAMGLAFGLESLSVLHHGVPAMSADLNQVLANKQIHHDSSFDARRLHLYHQGIF